MWAPREAGKHKEVDSPREPVEGSHTNQHLDFRIFDLQNYKIINLCYLKPSDLGLFVPAATGNECTQ